MATIERAFALHFAQQFLQTNTFRAADLKGTRDFTLADAAWIVPDIVEDLLLGRKWRERGCPAFRRTTRHA